MDKPLGSKLIEELNSNPSKFYKQGKTYQLLQEYFNGFPLETLRPLLCHEEPLIRRAAVWVTSELGVSGCSLLNDAITLIYDEDRYIRYHALEIVAVCSVGENLNEYIKIVSFLESNDDVIRVLVMRLISNADKLHLEVAARFFGLKGSYHKLHNEGLLKLLEVEKTPPEEVFLMINSCEPLTRKYGIIAAKKLFAKFPKIILDAVDNEDSDISRFSKEVIEIYSD